MSVYKAGLNLTLELEDVNERIPLVMFASDWAVNTIPSAMALLAVGREMSNGIKQSLAHEIGAGTHDLKKCKVYFKAAGEYDNGLSWPDQEVVIFEGRLILPGRVMMNGKLHLAAHLVHWLGDLNAGSAIDATFHPQSPLHYAFNAITSFRAQSGITSPSSTIRATFAGRAIEAANIQEDLWGKAIKPLLCELASAPQTIWTDNITGCFSTEKGRELNDDVVAALSRIDGETGGGCSRALSPYASKLALEGLASMPIEVAEAIAQAIGSEAADSFYGCTAWSKLLSYAGNFMFSVIPLVDHALVVPFTPLLRTTYCKEIEVRQLDHLETRPVSTRPLSGVFVPSTMRDETGLIGAPNTELSGNGGCYVPPKVREGAQSLIVPAPPWLDNIGTVGFSTRRSTGLSTKTPMNSAIAPGAQATVLKAARSEKTPGQIILEAADLFSFYAHTVYASEVLRNRVGRVQGKLRFDIAPGSVVKLHSFSDPFIKDDVSSRTVVAAIVHVSNVINAEQASAGTSYQFSHFRTEEENATEEMSVERHPMYSTTFKGAPLRDELAFGLCE